MTFIFAKVLFFLVRFPLPRNATPTANCTTEKQIHVVDACFWPLPLTTSHGEHLCVEPSPHLKQQLRDDMCSGHTSETTSGLTEQEANETELNNYLQAQ